MIFTIENGQEFQTGRKHRLKRLSKLEACFSRKPFSMPVLDDFVLDACFRQQ